MFGECTHEQLESFGLLPHQVEFVDEVISATRPARFLLIAPPGLGKSQAIIAAVRMLTSQGTAPTRCLVIVPTALQADWAGLLERVGGVEPLVVDAPAYRRLQAETPSEQNPWGSHQCIVTSIDFLRKRGRAEQALAVPWDVVVLDEVDQWPSERGRPPLAPRIWDADQVAVAIATTTSPDYVRWLFAPRVFRWTREDIRGWDGTPLSSTRRVSITTYQLSAPELRFDNRFEMFLADPSVAQVRRILLARRHSSIYALEQSLRRGLATTEYFIDYPRGPGRLPTEKLTDEEIEPSSLLWNVDWKATDCQLLLDLLEEIPQDSKWTACEELLREMGAGDERCVVLFTEFVDTAEYVSSLAQSSDWRTHLITSALSVDKRLSVLLEAQSEPGVLIVTTGATEGLNLATSDHVLHYDVPHLPKTLLRRYGTVEYSSSRFPAIHHHFLVADNTAAKSVLESVQAAAAEIEQMFRRR